MAWVDLVFNDVCDWYNRMLYSKICAVQVASNEAIVEIVLKERKPQDFLTREQSHRWATGRISWKDSMRK